MKINNLVRVEEWQECSKERCRLIFDKTEKDLIRLKFEASRGSVAAVMSLKKIAEGICGHLEKISSYNISDSKKSHPDEKHPAREAVEKVAKESHHWPVAYSVREKKENYAASLVERIGLGDDFPLDLKRPKKLDFESQSGLTLHFWEILEKLRSDFLSYSNSKQEEIRKRYRDAKANKDQRQMNNCVESVLPQLGMETREEWAEAITWFAIFAGVDAKTHPYLGARAKVNASNNDPSTHQKAFKNLLKKGVKDSLKTLIESK